VTAEVYNLEFYTIPEQLRQIADEIERGEHPGESASLVLDTKVIGMGTNHNNPMGILWDLRFAEHLMMKKAAKVVD
jgi:hypothetical protein